eukprot:scaffold650_cov249-Pinguiococcus_pyrenoidosus.AAC.22
MPVKPSANPRAPQRASTRVVAPHICVRAPPQQIRRGARVQSDLAKLPRDGSASNGESTGQRPVLGYVESCSFPRRLASSLGATPWLSWAVAI